jgi:prepilin-type processing-associated H-X9-DG protein
MQAGNRKMKLHQTTRGNRALTLTELLVVICVLAVLVAVLLPALRVPDGPMKINCVNNLKMVGLAFRIWEGDNGDKYPMQISVTNGGAMELALAGNISAIYLVMSNELSSPKVLICPQDAARHYATNFMTDLNHQTISYFVGLEADDKYPQMILSGDDNLDVNGVRVRPGILNLSTNASVGWTKERHGRAGNIGLVDGSVASVTVRGLQSVLVNTGTATNRLVIP